MNIEFQYYEDSISSKDLQVLLLEINKYDNLIKKISILPTHIKTVKKYISEQIQISTIIDFPFGSNDKNIRTQMIKTAIKNGAKSIEMVAPFNYMANSMFTDLKNDATMSLDICKNVGVDLSYVLEYRTFGYDCMYRACKILSRAGVNQIYISTGYKLDNIYDHLLAIGMINSNIEDINIVFCGDAYSNNHMDLLINANLTHIRLKSINSIELISKFIS